MTEKSEMYPIWALADKPSLFPSYTTQFYNLLLRYPSIISGDLRFFNKSFNDPGSRHILLVATEGVSDNVVGVITFFVAPEEALLYMEYIIIKPQFQHKGIARRLFKRMTEVAIRRYPAHYRDGFEAVLCDTRKVPSGVKGDPHGTIEGVKNTQRALEMFGFYTCDFSYLMPGTPLDGSINAPSDKFQMMCHKCSKGISQDGGGLSIPSDIIRVWLQHWMDDNKSFYDDDERYNKDYDSVLNVLPPDHCPLVTR